MTHHMKTYRSKNVSATCPLCHQELPLVIFAEDIVPPRRFSVGEVSRLPYHPLPVIAACDVRLAIHCPASNQVVYERCDGVHAPISKRYPACWDPACFFSSQSRVEGQGQESPR